MVKVKTYDKNIKWWQEAAAYLLLIQVIRQQVVFPIKTTFIVIQMSLPAQ